MHVACKNIEEPQQKNDPFTKNAANIFFLLEIEKFSIKCSPTYTLINGLNQFLNCLLFLHLLEIQVLFPVTGWGLHDDT